MRLRLITLSGPTAPGPSAQLEAGAVQLQLRDAEGVVVPAKTARFFVLGGGAQLSA